MQNRRVVIYALIILSLLTGLFNGRALFFNLAYMLTGLVLAAYIWSWFSVRWIGLKRRTRSSRAKVGQYLEEAFQLKNRTFIPKLWIELNDFSNLPGHRASQVIPMLGIRQSFTWRARTLCLSRGEFLLGPVTLSTGDPFGLFLLQRHIAHSQRLIVYPATVELARFELPMGVLSGGEAQRRRSHYVTTNASGVRDYAPGDSFNRIHWRSSARKNRLIVKEFEIDPLVDVWLFADYSRRSLYESPSVRRIGSNGPVIPAGREIPASTEEYITVIAASLAQHFVHLERALGFAAYTPSREIHQPDRGNRQLGRILETLAVARSVSDYTFGQMLALETPYLTRGTSLIAVTASPDKEWVHTLEILRRRGIQPFIIIVDPNSFGSPDRINNIQTLLEVSNIPNVVVRMGDDIERVLTQRPF